MMSNSDARKRAAEKAAADERAGDVEAFAEVLRRPDVSTPAAVVLASDWLATRDARLIAEAERRGAERALREAADEIDDLFPCAPSGHPGDRVEALVSPSWLRARAAQIGEVRP